MNIPIFGDCQPLTAVGGGRYDDGVHAPDLTDARSVRCPRCGTRIAWQPNPHRPFCSLTCRLIDLGVWLDERYRIAGEPLPSESNAEDSMPRGNG